MICPYCSSNETKVVDKRDSETITKRRRECLKCSKRFNTKEDVEKAELKIVKKDGRREDFSPEKIRKGIMTACEKRPINNEIINKLVSDVEEKLRKLGEKEIQTRAIGELVSEELKKIDNVAYIRFASVYRDFTDISDFKKEINQLTVIGEKK